MQWFLRSASWLIKNGFYLLVVVALLVGGFDVVGTVVKEWGSAMVSIPEGLSSSEAGVYHDLIRVAQQCKRPRPVVVITDVGKDYDDVAALTVLKELHRLGLVELRAVVANLMPAAERARFAKAVLRSLGLPDVPVACGTRGSPDGQNHQVLKHELEANEVEARMGEDAPQQQDGQDLLRDVYEKAKENGEKLYLLCLSSLQDIYQFSLTHPDLLAEHTAEVHMQGGNRLSEEGNLEPDSRAANNHFDIGAAERWHGFIQQKALPSHTYTKTAAFAAPLTSDVFVELEATGHPIGAYLRRVQVEQDVAFYKRACESDPEKRFAPFMDQGWFLTNKTNWSQRAHAQGDPLPSGEEVVPYLTKVVLYDVYAAVGVAGHDVVSKLKIVGICTDRTTAGKLEKVHHWITDREMDPAIANEIRLVMSSLLKGSLLDALKFIQVQ